MFTWTRILSSADLDPNQCESKMESNKLLRIRLMVLIVDGSSERVSHMWKGFFNIPNLTQLLN